MDLKREKFEEDKTSYSIVRKKAAGGSSSGLRLPLTEVPPPVARGCFPQAGAASQAFSFPELFCCGGLVMALISKENFVGL